MIGAIILGAGSGTRLNNGQPSEKPKVLYEICSRPMAAYTLDLLDGLGIKERVFVIGHKAEMVEKEFAGQTKFVIQENRNGTAHAAKLGEEKLDSSVSELLIIQGDDSAFYHKETIENFLKEAQAFKLAFTTVRLDDPGQYGRIIRDQMGSVQAIVEKESLSQEQKLINEVNAATYYVKREWFKKAYSKLQPSAVGKGEIIMTDLIAAAANEKINVLGYSVPSEEWVGVNTTAELEKANVLMKKRLNES